MLRAVFSVHAAGFVVQVFVVQVSRIDYRVRGLRFTFCGSRLKVYLLGRGGQERFVQNSTYVDKDIKFRA